MNKQINLYYKTNKNDKIRKHNLAQKYYFDEKKEDVKLKQSYINNYTTELYYKPFNTKQEFYEKNNTMLTIKNPYNYISTIYLRIDKYKLSIFDEILLSQMSFVFCIADESIITYNYATIINNIKVNNSKIIRKKNYMLIPIFDFIKFMRAGLPIM
jgi:hypothetical protein